MEIILKENEWADEAIKSRRMNGKPYDTLKRIARLYIDKGYKKNEIDTALRKYILQCDPSSNINKWDDLIAASIKSATKNKAVNIDCIEITDKEIETISSLNGKQIQRLAFTLLCLAKYWSAVSELSDGWVNNKDNEIMSMANINTSIQRQSAMFKTLKDAGLIQFSKKVDNTNVRVLFMDDGITVVKIYDFRNLGYQYLKLKGEPYCECENCGIVFKEDNPNKGRSQKYCKSCRIEIKVRQNVNSVMKHRYKNELKNECVGKNNMPKTVALQ